LASTISGYSRARGGDLATFAALDLAGLATFAALELAQLATWRRSSIRRAHLWLA
jgi:hypothetical protein